MQNNSIQRSEYLAKVASLYYDQGKTQDEIAQIVGVTRSAVSRLLTEARSKGIVEIVVHYPWRSNPELEKAMKDTFHLKDVRVLIRGNKTYEGMLRGLGILASQYFLDVLTAKAVVGISWGTGLYQMIRSLPSVHFPEVEVVQLIGATGMETDGTVGPLLANLLANQLGCSCRFLHAPLMMQSEKVRDAILEDRSIKDTLNRAKEADIALVGIGSTKAEIYNPLRTGYVNHEELLRIQEAGAIGTICAQHYNIQGEVLDIDINRRSVGINLKTLSQIDRIIGVAGGEIKAEAILGGLRGRFINVLITDDQAAIKILEMAKN